jgi:hypothetical protein
MFNVLSSIPVKSQKAIARGLLPVAGIAAFFGLVLTGLGIAGGETVEKCTGHLVWKECKDVYDDWSLGTSIFLMAAGIGLLVIAVVSLIAALRLTTMQGHLKRYLAILTGVESISVEKIADITNSRPSKVRDEIESMINSEMISDFYIDYSADQVVSRKYIPKTSHKTVVKCSECGGNNEVIVGITKHCGFCGQPLLLGTTRAT